MSPRIQRNWPLALGTALAVHAGWRLLRSATGETLAGQTVLITGGSRGLGLLLAREFAREGCRIAICARDGQELRSAVEWLRPDAQDVLAVECDVESRDSVEAMMATVTRRFGAIDVLVNNASIIEVGPVGTMDVGDFEHAMGVNFWGTLYAILALLPQMRERRSGRIVNITSIGGKVAVPHLLPYDCAKFAAVGLSEGLRSELARDGISVTTIVPGLMRTGSPVNAFFKGDPEREFAWFSVGDATPLTAMSAERAARRIVVATRRREAEVTLTIQAKLLRLFHDLLPGTATDLLGWVNRMLPRAEDVRQNVRGMELNTPISPSPLTGPMNRAARELNQYSGRARPSPEHAEAVGLEEGSRNE